MSACRVYPLSFLFIFFSFTRLNKIQIVRILPSDSIQSFVGNNNCTDVFCFHVLRNFPAIILSI